MYKDINNKVNNIIKKRKEINHKEKIEYKKTKKIYSKILKEVKKQKILKKWFLLYSLFRKVNYIKFKCDIRLSRYFTLRYQDNRIEKNDCFMYLYKFGPFYTIKWAGSFDVFKELENSFKDKTNALNIKIKMLRGLIDTFPQYEECIKKEIIKK